MEIEEEWNKIAKARLFDRLAGNDVSYNTVLLPTILEKINSKRKSIKNILDFGCGTGELTYEISKLNIDTIGLDISKRSIELAKQYFHRENLKFIDISLLDVKFKFKFDLIVANMSLMDTTNIEFNFSAICHKLKAKGTILITITHPAFWPIYWDYYNDPNFDYLRETKITKTYKTSKKVFSKYLTTHYHRPIGFYLRLFKENKMTVIDIQELRNPQDTVWYPRFLFFEIRK